MKEPKAPFLQVLACTLFLVAFNTVTLFAQTHSASLSENTLKPRKTMNGGTFVPEWQDTFLVPSPQDTTQSFQVNWFKGALLDEQIPNLPYTTILVPLKDNESGIRVAATSHQVEEVTTSQYYKSRKQAQLTSLAEWYPEEPVKMGEKVWLNKKAYQRVHLYPIQVHQSGNRIRQSAGVSYSVQKQRVPPIRPSSFKTQSDSSRLMQGEWYKIGILKAGIHKLDYSFFTSLGIDPAGLNPTRIQLFGNGGGMLPQIVGEHPYDDLEENAIKLVGMGDGKFDNGDYILFYGGSPNEWIFDQKQDRYRYRINHYSDTTFYFLTFNQRAGKRIQTRASIGGITHTPTFTRKYAAHEKDLDNPLLSGRSWLGESFDLTVDRTISFPLSRLVSGSEVKVNCRVSARSTIQSTFDFREGNTQLGTLTVDRVLTSYGATYYFNAFEEFRLPASQISDGSADIELHYTKQTASGKGWLDRIELEYQQRLEIFGSNWQFHSTDETRPGQVFGYTLKNANAAHEIWDITDGRNITVQQATLNGSQLSFGVQADSLKHFLVNNGTSYRAPASWQKIRNQNLHHQPQADFLIVTHPLFRGQANRLAEFHRNHLGQTVNVAEINQVYNEFSSGSPDPTAIRDYVHLFYDRAGTDPTLMPKYLLLMGDGSYDAKDRFQTGNNFIPTYQSRVSNHPPTSYAADDFLGFQDVGEGYWGEKTGIGMGFPYDTTTQTHLIDVAVGRLPVKTPQEAEEMVEKIIAYASKPAGMGPWRNNVVLIADAKDNERWHTTQSNGLAGLIDLANPCINIDKIFLDNYEKVSVPDGSRYPDAKEELIKGINAGALLVNYTGHGGETGWSNAKILEIPDIIALENENKYPAFMTATCEFGRWDDPGRVCGAEHLVLNPKGGAIVMFTTVRVVYSGENESLNREFYLHALSWDADLGRYLTVGEIHQRTKNETWAVGIGRYNSRNFTLLGDPALTLAYPELTTKVNSLNGITPVAGVVDTFAALTKLQVTGEITDAAGQIQSTLNGDLSVIVYDKPSRFTTKTYRIPFSWQKNKVFNGRASVKDGKFDFEFVVPLDASYEAGTAKISLYFQNGQQDAGGCFQDLYVGGTDPSAISDDLDPELTVVMNDEKFTDGQMVGPDPLMIARIFDESGINTVGTGIGHELTAVLDGDEQNALVLNEYYVAEKDDFQAGTIEYPFEQLAEGEHELKVKVWDVANNSADTEIRFVVSSDANIALGHVLNYPNPFTTNTKFILEHNKHGALLDCTVKIYTVSGKMVKALESTFFAEGNLYCDLEWDGLDEWGDAIGRGTYIYQVTLRDRDSGESVNRFEKLVLLR